MRYMVEMRDVNDRGSIIGIIRLTNRHEWKDLLGKLKGYVLTKTQCVNQRTKEGSKSDDKDKWDEVRSIAPCS